MPEPRIPAEVFPPGEYLADEMKARGWETADVAARMGATTERELQKDFFIVELILAVHDKGLIMDSGTAFKLGRAFGTSGRYWINLDRMWRGLPSLDSNQ